MKNKNKTETELLLEFTAKNLSWDLRKEITPFQVFIGLKVHLLTKAPFRDCIEAAYQANKQILN